MGDGELTFFEAMALVGRNEANLAEVWIGAIGEWTSLALQVDDDTPLSVFRHPSCKFRRARPKRSRVQEMAERFYADTPAGALLADYTGSAMKEAIRAVCEFLRTAEAGHMVNHDLPGQVEREFLVPR